MKSACTSRRLLAAVVVAVSAGCTPPPAEFSWPDPTGPVKQDLKVKPENGVFLIDTVARKKAVVDYEVTQGGADIGAKVRLEAEEVPFGDFEGTKFTSGVMTPRSGTGPILSSLVGAILPDGKMGFAWNTLVFVRSTGDKPDYAFEVAEDGTITGTSATFSFSPRLGDMDVAVVMDTTGSMGGAIDNLRNSLQTELFPTLKTLFPNARMAVFDHRDYTDAWVVKVLTPMTPSLPTAVAAVEKLVPGGGDDLPEAQVPAMYYAITGNPIRGVPAVPRTATSFGAAQFSTSATTVLILITDAAWHDVTGDPFPSTVVNPPTIADLRAAFLANKVRFVDITIAGQESQADRFSDETNSFVTPSSFAGKCGPGKCCTGVSGAARDPTAPGGNCRLNFLHENGVGVTGGIIQALKSIAVDAKFELSLQVTSDVSNPNATDVSGLVVRPRAMEEGDPSRGCPPRAAIDRDGDGVKEAFASTTLEGAAVCFDVQLVQQTGLARQAGFAQAFIANVNLIGQPGNVVLDSRRIIYAVPPQSLVAK